MPRSESRYRTTARRFALAAAFALPGIALAAPATAQDVAAPEAESPIALITGAAAGLAAEPETGPFHPVDGPVDYGDALAGFGNERGRPHEGQDILGSAGTPVVSPTRTEVLETGADGGRGNWAALYDKDADRTYVYFHMEAPAEVGAGQRLAPGERVGRLGCTGSCSGPNLHFEIRDGADPYGAARDPLPDLQRWQPIRGE